MTSPGRYPTMAGEGVEEVAGAWNRQVTVTSLII